MPERAPEKHRAPWRAVLGAAVILTGVAAGASFAGLDWRAYLGGGDGLTDQQAAARQAAFAAAGPILLAEVPPAEQAAAMQAMGLPADQQEALARLLGAQHTRLVYVTLWDDLAEDDDTVRVESQGFAQTVVLKNAPVRLAIPVANPASVTLIGVHDGGGGITVAVKSGDQKVPLPRMSVGQTVTFPAR